MENRLSEALKYIRKRTKYNGKIGISIRSLAKESDISAPYISRLEQPDSKIKPSQKTILSLAKGLTKESTISMGIMNVFLLSTMGLITFNRDDALHISNSLANSDFKHFLNEVLDYNPEEAKSNNKQIVKELKQAVSLNDISNKNSNFILDGQKLNTAENNILLSLVDGIRKNRKVNNGE